MRLCRKRTNTVDRIPCALFAGHSTGCRSQVSIADLAACLVELLSPSGLELDVNQGMFGVNWLLVGVPSKDVDEFERFCSSHEVTVQKLGQTLYRPRVLYRVTM